MPAAFDEQCGASFRECEPRTRGPVVAIRRALPSDFAEVYSSVLATAAYYDVVNFARRVKAPGVYSRGYNDETCSPTSTYAAYNVITAPKTLLLALETGHGNIPEQVERVDAWLMEYLKTAPGKQYSRRWGTIESDALRTARKTPTDPRALARTINARGVEISGREGGGDRDLYSGGDSAANDSDHRRFSRGLHRATCRARPRPAPFRIYGAKGAVLRLLQPVLKSHAGTPVPLGN